MGTFGNELWNVLAIDRTQWMSPPAIPAQDGDAAPFLRAICAQAADTFPTGVIVYLPPRPYVIRGNTSRSREFMVAFEGADLQTRRNVTLWFAPGAYLVIQPEAVVRLDGPLRAEPTKIFQCEGEDVLADPGRGIRAARRGRVILNSSTVAEVYPEWWGAIPSPDDGFYRLPIDDTDALEDCIRSAHTLRVNTAGILPTIPIVLRGRYFLRRELEISSVGPRLGDGSFDSTRALTPNPSGIILLGRQQGGAQSQSSSRLQATTNFMPSGRAPDIKTKVRSRALLRLEGLHASLIDGVTFAGGEPGDSIASVCVQVTGNNARSTVFRGCSFVNAKHILVQVGDYIILDQTRTLTANGRRFFPLAASVSGGWDLSGLRFENCRFEAELKVDEVPPGGNAAAEARRAELSDRAREVTGIVFHANNTLPMTLDNCFFLNGMAACVAAYGGTMIVRGGGAQNTTLAAPRNFGMAPEEPVGGVDFFLGDPILQEVVGPMAQAASPTGLTVIQFESQSDQFLATFSHISTSAGKVAFYPTTLQGVSQRATSGFTQAPASVVWLGPGISGMDSMGRIVPASTLTLVGCAFGGKRHSRDSSRENPSFPAAGGIVVDFNAFLVADVGTRVANPSPAVFYTRGAGSTEATPLYGPSRPIWLISIGPGA